MVRQALVEQVGVLALGGGAVMDRELRAELLIEVPDRSGSRSDTLPRAESV